MLAPAYSSDSRFTIASLLTFARGMCGSESFDVFAGTNPTDDDALGDTDWCWQVTDDFDEQHASVQQQMDSDLATAMLREIIGEPHLLKLDAPPNIYSEDNRVGDGSLHHDPRYRINPVFGPQPV